MWHRDTGLLSVGSEINHYIILGLIFLPCVNWGGCRTHLLVPPHLFPPLLPRPFQLPHTAELGSASGSCIHTPSATGHPSLSQQFPHCTARWLIFSIFSELLEVRDRISHILESQVLCRVPGPQRCPANIWWSGPKWVQKITYLLSNPKYLDFSNSYQMQSQTCVSFLVVRLSRM